MHVCLSMHTCMSICVSMRALPHGSAGLHTYMYALVFTCKNTCMHVCTHTALTCSNTHTCARHYHVCAKAADPAHMNTRKLTLQPCPDQLHMHEHNTAPHNRGIPGGNGHFWLLLSMMGLESGASGVPVTHRATGGNLLFILALLVPPVTHGAGEGRFLFLPSVLAHPGSPAPAGMTGRSSTNSCPPIERMSHSVIEALHAAAPGFKA